MAKTTTVNDVTVLPIAGRKGAEGTINYGMTLRDLFALEVLKEILKADRSFMLVEGGDNKAAETAYTMADLMMRARDRIP